MPAEILDVIDYMLKQAWKIEERVNNNPHIAHSFNEIEEEKRIRKEKINSLSSRDLAAILNMAALVLNDIGTSNNKTSSARLISKMIFEAFNRYMVDSIKTSPLSQENKNEILKNASASKIITATLLAPDLPNMETIDKIIDEASESDEPMTLFMKIFKGD